jgi:hypothetical protein
MARQEICTRDPATLYWAITEGCPWGVWPDQYCTVLPQEALDWAHAHGLACSHVGAERSAGAVRGGCAVVLRDGSSGAAVVTIAAAAAAQDDSDDDLK